MVWLTAWIRSAAGLTAANFLWLVKRRRSPRIDYYASNRRVYRPRSLRKCAFLLRTTVCNRLPTATLFVTGNFWTIFKNVSLKIVLDPLQNIGLKKLIFLAFILLARSNSFYFQFRIVHSLNILRPSFLIT